METISSSKIVCPQCAGENEVPADGKFLECQFCGSAIYVDKRKIVNHYIVTSNFSEIAAEGNLRRWMAGNFHVKDLDKNAQITAKYFYYFPLWYFKTQDGGGDKIYLQPASTTSVSEIKSIKIPAGSMQVFKKKDVDMSQIVNPDVLYDSAKSWLAQTGVNTESIAESNLVHIPFYQFYYTYNETQYTAMIEASSGAVYANIWPVKSEMPFKLLFALSIVTFFCVSMFSFFVAYLLGGNASQELVIGEMIKAVSYGAASIPLVLIAYFVAKKV
ncbi:MAG: hypothetical protein NTV87_10680 [Ignavibacteriae bacterium]|jgi:hypothetical protein|nr:hypothetical protein [Ignavibacteriota bacterium]